MRPPVIAVLRSAVYTVPTDSPETDGTFEWNSTTVVIVEVTTNTGHTGLGYTYASPAAAVVIREHLAPVIIGYDAMETRKAWDAMTHAVRNIGRPGIASAGISAVDTALWDLKARLLEVPLVIALGAGGKALPMYGSGGFTSYSIDELQSELTGWVEQGIPRVKMKVGRDPDVDVQRVRAARAAIGDSAELYVDANAAYTLKQALKQSKRFAEANVSWFEEPVSADDLDDLRLLRETVGAGMDIAGGEYGYDLVYFRRMLEARAVSVLQADATRCGGFTELLRIAALSAAYGISLSTHTAPALHLHVACAIPNIRHMEYFHDHVRIEQLFFDGVASPRGGTLAPDTSRPGMGLELKRADVSKFRSK